MKHTADGAGVASHARAALLPELADESGRTAGWTQALLGTYKGQPMHLPGRVLTDLAVALAVLLGDRRLTPPATDDLAKFHDAMLGEPVPPRLRCQGRTPTSAAAAALARPCPASNNARDR